MTLFKQMNILVCGLCLCQTGMVLNELKATKTSCDASSLILFYYEYYKQTIHKSTNSLNQGGGCPPTSLIEQRLATGKTPWMHDIMEVNTVIFVI